METTDYHLLESYSFLSYKLVQFSKFEEDLQDKNVVVELIAGRMGCCVTYLSNHII